MAGGNSGRQKMINMMYLVLTAMLALNVSAEVLDAFVKIEESLGQTVAITNMKNDQVITEFKAARDAQGEEKVGKWADRAEEIRAITKTVVDSIQNIKLALVRHVDTKDTLTSIVDGVVVPDGIKARDNTSGGDQFLIAMRNGYLIEDIVARYKSRLISEIKEFDEKGTLTDEISKGLNLEVKANTKPGEGKERRTWPQFTFEGTPLIANIATISKLQMDVLLAETSILTALRSQIGKTDFKISTIIPMVNNPSGVILKGSSAKAEVFLAAYDASMNPEVTVGGSKVPVRDGKGIITLSGTTIGPKKLFGTMTFQGPDGTVTEKFEVPYHVMEPNFVVSPSKMNVFYLGVENPISISVAGVPIDKVTVTAQNGTISGSGNNRMFKPQSAGKAFVSVSAAIDGKTQSMGPPIEFRVKRVPSPTPQILGIEGKSAAKSALASSQGLIAKMPDDFDFDLKFNIKSFKLSVVEGGFLKEEAAGSAAFTQKQKDLVRNTRSTRVLITDIKASGPDGTVRDLGDLVYTVR